MTVRLAHRRVGVVPCRGGCGARVRLAAATCRSCWLARRAADAAARLATPVPALTSGPVRPAAIVINGGTLRLGLHDAYFRTEYARLRQQMLDCHPDRREQTRIGIGSGGRLTRNLQRIKYPHSTGAWRKARQVLGVFFATEDRWYAPTGWGAPVVARYGLSTPVHAPPTRKLLIA